MKPLLNGAYLYKKGEKFFTLYNNSNSTCDVQYVFTTEKDLLDFVDNARELLEKMEKVKSNKLFMDYKAFDKLCSDLNKIYCLY